MDIIIVISGIVYLVDLRRPENEIYLVSKSRASFFFVLLLVSIFRLFFLLFFIVFPFSLFFFFFYFICKFLGRSDRSFVQELQYVFLNKYLQSFRTTLDMKRRTLECLPRGPFPFCSRLERLFNASAFNFLDFLFLFFSFYIVGEVLYQRIADFNLRNPTNHFYEWTIFDLFTRVISMRYFKRIEREVLMSTFFLRSLRSILSFTYFVRSHKKQ